MSDKTSQVGILVDAIDKIAQKVGRLGVARVGAQGAVDYAVENVLEERRRDAKNEVKDLRTELIGLVAHLESQNAQLSEELAHYMNDAKKPKANEVSEPKDPQYRGPQVGVAELKAGDIIDIGPRTGGPFEEWIGAKFKGNDGKSFVNVLSVDGLEGDVDDGNVIHLVERPSPSIQDLREAPEGTKLVGDWISDSTKNSRGDWSVDYGGGKSVPYEAEELSIPSDSKLVYP